MPEVTTLTLEAFELIADLHSLYGPNQEFGFDPCRYAQMSQKPAGHYEAAVDELVARGYLTPVKKRNSELACKLNIEPPQYFQLGAENNAVLAKGTQKIPVAILKPFLQRIGQREVITPGEIVNLRCLGRRLKAKLCLPLKGHPRLKASVKPARKANKILSPTQVPTARTQSADTSSQEFQLLQLLISGRARWLNKIKSIRAEARAKQELAEAEEAAADKLMDEAKLIQRIIERISLKP